MIQLSALVSVALGVLLASLPLASALPPAALEKRAVPFGQLIYTCTTPGKLAFGFDDGPYIYTPAILDKLKAANFKATFFVNGNNKASIYNYNSTIQKMIADGHQVASHTWGHVDLTTLTTAQIQSQMLQLEDALKNIIGKFPTYMRPPFLNYNSQVLSTLGALQYVVIYGDLNTKDWMYQSETDIVNAENLFVSGLDAQYSIGEAHDPEYYTANYLVDFMISEVARRGIQTVTICECMGQTDSECYRTSRDTISSSTTATGSSATTTSSSSASPSASGTVSPNGRCGMVGGGQNLGYVCPSPKCCSRYGYCGTSSDYCQSGSCQPLYGVCGATLPPGSVSPDNSCGNVANGNNKGFVCPSGQCCSQYGWCGTSGDAAYCGTGCQPSFGTCS